MDKIAKALQKLSLKDKKKIKRILELILKGDFSHFDMKKLKDRDDVYRVRSGNLRIIFRKTDGGKIFILAVERRNESTYKNI